MLRLRLVLVLLFAMVLPAAAERIVLDKPLPIATEKSDKTPIRGRLTAWDRAGFDWTDAKNQAAHADWSELDPKNIFQIRSKLIGGHDADGWIALGSDLLKADRALSDRAFDRALRIDPNAKSRIEAARHDDGAGNGDPGKSVTAASAPAGDPVSGPKVVGAPQSLYWGKLSDEDQAAQVVRLKKFADGAQATLTHPLKLQETKYFLFYSDLSAAESQKWSGLLDRMYGRLAELFGVAHGRNVWRGKALILVFAAADDYRRYEREVQTTEPGESAGMTHCYGDGIVSIAFYRQPQELTFAHVLVHESVHGFVHRYRSPASVPSWANEGLAEAIASELVPDPGRAAQVTAMARSELTAHKGKLGAFFTLEHIEGWQYPVAETFSAWMIRQNKKAYVQFIDGIKDGKSPQESLETSYKSPLSRIVSAYGQSLSTPVSLQ